MHGLEKWRDHLWVAGNQVKKFDEEVQRVSVTSEVWLIDFAMTWSLVQASKETQSQFFDKKYANDLGVIRYVREQDGKIGRHYNDFMSEDNVSISRMKGRANNTHKHLFRITMPTMLSVVWIDCSRILNPEESRR
jgi:hypothetical protein